VPAFLALRDQPLDRLALDLDYIWHTGTKAGIVQDSLAACGFETRSQIIWAKNNFAIGRGHYHCKHEPCWYVVRKGSTASWVGDHSQTTLWQIDKNLKSETEAKMRVIIPTLVGLVALAATSVQAAPVATNPHQHLKWHETPAQNVRKSQHYDHLVASNSSYRSSRMRKERGPIRDAELRASCVGSFNEYEPR
jgi:hypothetical protein